MKGHGGGNEQFIYILLHKEKRVAEDEMVRDHH